MILYLRVRCESRQSIAPVIRATAILSNPLRWPIGMHILRVFGSGARWNRAESSKSVLLTDGRIIAFAETALNRVIDLSVLRHYLE